MQVAEIFFPTLDTHFGTFQLPLLFLIEPLAVNELVFDKVD